MAPLKNTASLLSQTSFINVCAIAHELNNFQSCHFVQLFNFKELKIATETLDVYGVGTLFSQIKTGQKNFTAQTAVYRPLYNEYQAGLKLFNVVDFDGGISWASKIALPNLTVEFA